MVVSVENEDVKLTVSVTVEPRSTVGDVVVEEGSVVGLVNGFVGFDSTVGLGFVMAEVARTGWTEDKGPVFSVVVVACTGLDTGFEVDAGILVGFGLAIVVDGFEVVALTVVGLTFCVGLVVAMVVNF